MPNEVALARSVVAGASALGERAVGEAPAEYRIEDGDTVVRISVERRAS